MNIYLRFADLKARGIVANRATLKRWVDAGRFPPPIKIGPNTAVWPEGEIEQLLEERAAERKVVTAS